MIDLKEVEIIAKWVREQQAENPKSMDLIFGGKEETLAQALEALPGLVETMQLCKNVITTEFHKDGKHVVLQKLVSDSLAPFTTKSTNNATT